jgi:hypothetical protein
MTTIASSAVFSTLLALGYIRRWIMKLVPVWRGGTEWFEFLLIIACSYVSFCFRVTQQ